MTAERENELFAQYVNSKYSQLVSKAHNKALCELNNGNMPKKVLINEFKKNKRFPELVEKYKAKCDEYHILDIRSGNAKPEHIDHIKQSPEFEYFCREHENEEEKAERIRLEQEERDKITKYLESDEFNELITSSMEMVKKKMIEKIKNHFRSIEALGYETHNIYQPRHNYDYYDDYYYQDEPDYIEADDIDEYLDNIVDYNDKLENSLLEYICDVEYSNCGVCDEVEKRLPEWTKTLQYDYCDELFEYISDESCEEKTYESVQSYFTRETIIALLKVNPYTRNLILEKEKEEQKNRETEQIILNTIPERYADLFPLARKMKRHFVLHVGPTNSGKTHDAIEKMKTGNSGIYLAPLRLLAYEQFEGLNHDGVPCTLLTGEEKIEVPNAGFTASTIEMANYTARYDYAVIDEAQMIADPSRGGSWTFAILGILADEIHVCMSANAEKLIIRLINECDDTYEIVRHERKTPLEFDPTVFNQITDAKKGDALIVFSRNNVHAVASELTKQGFKCSVIYGSLPYSVRHEQAELFASGKTDIVVATDAIGMGMNLPIRRVVFLEHTKYDGQSRRDLYLTEIQQIAGRAGRFGLYDIGYVTSFGNRKEIKRKLITKPKDLERAVMAFPESLLGINEKLSTIIERWNAIDVQDGYEKAVSDRELKLCYEMENITDNKRFIYRFITIPFNEKEVILHQMWTEMYKAELYDKVFPIEKSIPAISNNLTDMERDYRICDLLYVYASRFNHTEHIEDIQKRKVELSKRISAELSKKKLTERRCKHCGRTMPWNYPYGICKKCHDQLYPRYYDYDEDDDYYDDEDDENDYDDEDDYDILSNPYIRI